MDHICCHLHQHCHPLHSALRNEWNTNQIHLLDKCWLHCSVHCRGHIETSRAHTIGKCSYYCTRIFLAYLVCFLLSSIQKFPNFARYSIEHNVLLLELFQEFFKGIWGSRCDWIHYWANIAEYYQGRKIYYCNRYQFLLIDIIIVSLPMWLQYLCI